MLRRIPLVIALGAGLMSGAAAHAKDISGAGATFPYPIYAKWADAYKKETGIGLNYQSIGSGGGIKQITAKTVDFGASDMPLKPEQLDKIGLMQFPTVMGGVVPVVNIKGVKPGQITLTGEILADIYLGKITKWNDAAIKKLNPSRQAARRRRSRSLTVPTARAPPSSSPTTSPRSARSGRTRSGWAPRSSGRPASAARAMKALPASSAQTKGSIGYVEYAYAKQNNLAHVKLVNSDGKPSSPSAKSFQAAAAGADWANSDGFYMMLTERARRQTAGRSRGRPSS